MIGWIRIDRKITENPIWEDKPYSKGQAWIDILLCANYEDKKIIVNNKTTIIERGTLFTTERKLAERWGWSSHKVRNFLDFLTDENMIVRKREQRGEHKGTAINVVNYRLYQDVADKKGAEKGAKKEHTGSTEGARTRGDTLNNIIINKQNNNVTNIGARTRAGNNGWNNYHYRRPSDYYKKSFDAAMKASQREINGAIGKSNNNISADSGTHNRSNANDRITFEQSIRLQDKADQKGVDIEKILSYMGVKYITELTQRMYDEAIDLLDKYEDKE